jgi:regulatory protein
MAMDCRDAALKFLEHRERSVHEVKSHLRSKGFREEEIETELEYLKSLHYLDDVRYCGSYISYGLGKGRGPVRLQFELAEKGIDGATIQEALESCFDRSAEKAAALKEAEKLLKRQGSADYGPAEEAEEDRAAPDEKTIARIGRRLASLGYHTDIIYDIIGQVRKSR